MAALRFGRRDFGAWGRVAATAAPRSSEFPASPVGAPTAPTVLHQGSATRRVAIAGRLSARLVGYPRERSRVVTVRVDPVLCSSPVVRVSVAVRVP